MRQGLYNLSVQCARHKNLVFDIIRLYNMNVSFILQSMTFNKGNFNLSEYIKYNNLKWIKLF